MKNFPNHALQIRQLCSNRVSCEDDRPYSLGIPIGKWNGIFGPEEGKKRNICLFFRV